MRARAKGGRGKEACPLEAEGFVLAGGRSTRMGCDKALIAFEGSSLIEHALSTVSAVVDAPRIAGSRPDLERFAPVIADLHADCGPLGGIEAALAASAQALNLFLAVDLPLIPSQFLRWMLERAGKTGAMATIPVIGDFPQPLAAVYRREFLPGLSRALEHGRCRTIDTIREEAASKLLRVDIFRVEMLAAAGQLPFVECNIPISGWFRNVNTPEDLGSISGVR